MKVSQANPPQGRFDQVFQMASEATGTSFEYLLATAKRESSLRPELKAATSSATGLFQFVEQTWLRMVKEEGGDLGLSSFSDAINVDARGRATVNDPTLRQQILDLRKDPTLSAVMAGRLTRKNAGELERTLGRPPTDGELYIAHFMGATGAGRLIDLARADPLANAAKAFPKAAEANPTLFFDKTGRARGAAELYTELVARHPDQARQAIAGVTANPSAEVAASRVAVAFSALQTETLADARQPIAPGFDGFRAKPRGEPFTAKTAAADPFRAVMKPPAEAATEPPIETPAAAAPLAYVATLPTGASTARPLPAAATSPAGEPTPLAAPEPRRSRLVTDPTSWGGQRPPTARSMSASPPRSTEVVLPAMPAAPPVAAPAAMPAAPRPNVAAPPAPQAMAAPAPSDPPARATQASTTLAPAVAEPRRPRAPMPAAGILATPSGPAHANRGIAAPEARPLDLTGFLSYRVPREQKDVIPPL
jgi:hypothetical protein